MLRLDKVIKPWKESAALNDHINLYGFWNETAFLTKSGDLGRVASADRISPYRQKSLHLPTRLSLHCSQPHKPSKRQSWLVAVG